MALYFQDRSEFIAYFQNKAERSQQTSINIINSKSKVSKANQTNFKNGIQPFMGINKERKNGFLVERWDYLYQLEKVRKEKIKQKQDSQLKYLNLKIMEECTFTPKLISYSRSKSRNIPVFAEECKTSDLNSRSENWARKKNAKNENLKQKLESHKLQECKFHPKIVSFN